MQELTEHAQHPDSKRSLFHRLKRVIVSHQTASIIALFITLPIVVISAVAVFIHVSKQRSTLTAQLTPTPTFMPRDEGKDIVEISNTPIPSVSVKSTLSPTAKVTATVKPTTSPSKESTKTPTPGATATTVPSLANLYFHSIVCNYTQTASGSTTIKRLDDVTFASSADVPATATCDVVFQNAEEVETGEITYSVYSDNDQQKSTTVGKLKKGNYPTSEYKGYQEIVTLKTTAGSHEIKFELNPEHNGSRAFAEKSYTDNYRAIPYKVQ